MADTASIDHDIATRRLIAESDKFAAEQRKLIAEALKFERERALAPWAIAGTMMTAGAALFGAGVAFTKLVGL